MGLIERIRLLSNLNDLLWFYNARFLRSLVVAAQLRGNPARLEATLNYVEKVCQARALVAREFNAIKFWWQRARDESPKFE